MPLSAADRTTFQDLMPALGDDADPRPMTHFALAHRDALLDELRAVPGVEKVRAGILRMLVSIEPDETVRRDLVREAGSAILVPVGPSPVDRIARHPAWVGLAMIELSKHQHDWEGDPIERAAELAGRAFAGAGTPDEVGEGEVLWALSEEAAEAGWLTLAHELLERAVEADFADDGRRADVALLAALRRLARGSDAVALLERAAVEELATDQTQTHAAWILAHTVIEADAQLTWLRRAAQTVDRDDNADVAAKIDAAIAARHQP